MTEELLMYHRQVKNKLDCPKSMRDKFLVDARHMTDNFLAENPGATLDELKSAVGEPEQLATMFLESVDSDIVEGFRKRKKRMKRLAVILLIATLIAAMTFSIYGANYRRNYELTKESTIIIYETEEE